jgi:hypothetical protein
MTVSYLSAVPTCELASSGVGGWGCCVLSVFFLLLVSWLLPFCDIWFFSLSVERRRGEEEEGWSGLYQVVDEAGGGERRERGDAWCLSVLLSTDLGMVTSWCNFLGIRDGIRIE